MEISLVKDLHIYDAGTERNIQPILNKIHVTENEVTLNFCDCGVDYPATSKILDRVLNELSKMEGQKRLSVIFDFKINELALHKWFFIGSEFFDISEFENSYTNDQFKERIATKLNQTAISMSIIIWDEKNNPIKTITYGN
jgi:hypothetical protein